ncbi:unnamed protein product [Orchesella dallaii]|uniref:Odorant receptor n=1 Tax=Orchesella dallaii TaxID=48710 RepID=A0ABP1RH63_9HEXA
MGIMVYTIYLEEMVGLFNRVVVFFNFVQRVYLPKTFDPNKCVANKVIDFGTALMLVAFTVLILFTSSVMIIFPRLPFLIGSIIPEKYFILPVRLIVTPIQIYISVSVHITTLLLGISIYYYLCMITPIVTQELRMDQKKYKTLDRLRTPETLIKVYRSLQLLNISATYSCGPFIVPQQFIFSKFIVYCNYMLIVYSQQMSWATICLLGFWAFTFSLYWTTLLSFGGYLYVHCRRVLLSWKYHTWNCSSDTKLMSKFRRSCTPITLQFGTTFIIKSLTVLKFIRGLTVGTFRALMISGRR